MKKQLSLLVAIIFLLLAGSTIAAGCGDDENSAPSVERSQFVQKFADAACARAYSCCSDDELSEYVDELGVTTEEECRPVLAEQIAASYEEANAAADEGMAKYHADKAGACVASFASVSCGASDLADECDEIFSGNIAQGDECQASNQCREGRCGGIEYDDDFNVSQPGACQPYLELGETCDYGDCGPNAYCDDIVNDDTGGFTYACVALKDNGEACEDFDGCKSGYCEAPADDPGGQAVCSPAPEEQVSDADYICDL